MRAVDLIRFSYQILKSLSESDIRIDDYKYLAMYDRYSELEKQGEKKEYIRCILSEEFDMSESSVFRIISRLNKHVKI